MRLAALVFFSAALVSVSAQVQYGKGQNVAPVFEGWEHNPDGTYNMVFGYLNRNFEEEVDVPIGADNSITIKGETFGDRGQPTHFYQRRQRFIFRVVVPADFDKKERVVWTLTSHGKTDKANGWLQPEWELNDDVIVENMGGGVRDPENKPPSVTIAPVQSVTLPGSATLTASATDDGLPKPYRRSASNAARNAEPRRPSGVGVNWIQYRGPGKATFEPAKSEIVQGQPVSVTSKVSFSAPGTYVLRAIAFDGQLLTTRDVTVTVNPASSSQD
jgi:hypothetical protein